MRGRRCRAGGRDGCRIGGVLMFRFEADLKVFLHVRPEKSLEFLFHGSSYDLMKPVVPSTVPYLDMRSR